MTFIEAAIALLGESRRSLSTEALAELAVDRELLSRPGKNPVSNMKRGLNAELRKGEESRVEQTKAGQWRLVAGAKTGASDSGRRTRARRTRSQSPRSPSTGRADARATAEVAGGPAAKARGTERNEPEPARAATQPSNNEADDESVAAGEFAEADDLHERDHDAAEPDATRSEPQVASVSETPGLAEVLAPPSPVQKLTQPVTEEEAALEELYGDELSATEPGAAFSEYEDARTADEDRPLLPEIVTTKRDRLRRERRRDRRGRAGRDGDDASAAGADEPRGPRRRRERRSRRGEEARRGGERQPDGATRDGAAVRDADTRADAPADKPETGQFETGQLETGQLETGQLETGQPETGQPETGQPETGQPRGDVGGPGRGGTALADGAFEAMSVLRGDQAVHVKQLAHMMRKRQLLAGDPEVVWPLLKAALLHDERRQRADGFRPRIVYRGRDLFTRGQPVPAAVADAEAEVAAAHERLARATHDALGELLRGLDLSQLEQIAHVYLLRTGHTRLRWIKQVQRSSYALAIAPDGVGEILVGVRAGREPVDRRGVGELRAGVEAKNVVAGLLLAPSPLSEDARHELGFPRDDRGHPRKSVTVVCGEGLAAQLIGLGVGVLVRSVPALYLDHEWFAELGEPSAR